jgi:hypothetical protein
MYFVSVHFGRLTDLDFVSAHFKRVSAVPFRQVFILGGLAPRRQSQSGD